VQPERRRVRVQVFEKDFNPARGDRVYDKRDKSKELGTIVEPGTEQSMVKWDALPNAQPQGELNKYLAKDE
jgi:hypothetical protein